MKFSPPLPRARFPLGLAGLGIALALVLGGEVSGDIVVLKDGTTLEGEILEEDENSIRMRYRFRGGVMDTRVIARSDIVDMTVTEPDQDDYEAMRAAIPSPTPDLMTAAEYDELIEGKIRPFLEKHSFSPLAEGATRLAESLMAEKERVLAGDRKIGGEWVESSRYQRLKKRYDAKAGHMVMAERFEARDYLGAMQELERIEKHYEGTSGYADAIALGKQVLPPFAREIQRLIDAQPRAVEDRANGLAAMEPSVRVRAEEALAGVKKRHEEKLAREKEEGLKWLSYDVLDLRSLEATNKLIADTSKRLAAIDEADIRAYAEALERITDEILDRRFLRAAEAIVEAQQAGVPERLLGEVKKQLDEMQKAAGDAASAAREQPRGTRAEERGSDLVGTPDGDIDDITRLANTPMRDALAQQHDESERLRGERAGEQEGDGGAVEPMPVEDAGSGGDAGGIADPAEPDGMPEEAGEVEPGEEAAGEEDGGEAGEAGEGVADAVPAEVEVIGEAADEGEVEAVPAEVEEIVEGADSEVVAGEEDKVEEEVRPAAAAAVDQAGGGGIGENKSLIMYIAAGLLGLVLVFLIVQQQRQKKQKS
jgi:hypothetical protein